MCVCVFTIVLKNLLMSFPSKRSHAIHIRVKWVFFIEGIAYGNPDRYDDKEPAAIKRGKMCHACRVAEIQMVVPWIPWDNYLVANNGECLFVGEINKLSIGHRFGIWFVNSISATF